MVVDVAHSCIDRREQDLLRPSGCSMSGRIIRHLGGHDDFSSPRRYQERHSTIAEYLFDNAPGPVCPCHTPCRSHDDPIRHSRTYPRFHPLPFRDPTSVRLRPSSPRRYSPRAVEDEEPHAGAHRLGQTAVEERWRGEVEAWH